MKLEASFSLTNINDSPVAIIKIDYYMGLKLQEVIFIKYLQRAIISRFSC